MSDTLPPIGEDERTTWDVQFFSKRYDLTGDTISYHMRQMWGKVRRGDRRELDLTKALRFDRYIRKAMQKNPARKRNSDEHK